MKKLITLMSFLLAIGLFVAQSQTIPNGDFESWVPGLSYDQPTSWDTPNESISALATDYVVFDETTDIFAGSHSVKLECKDIVVFFQTITVPGFVTLGDLSVNTVTQEVSINGGVPFTDRPDKLTGNFKYLPSGTDNCVFEVVLLNYDASTSTILDTIGQGVFTSSATSTAWDYFEAVINYNSSATPNYMNINLLSSENLNAGSIVYVDNLEFYTAPTILPDLFISEYIEGTSNNKALEIYNGTGASVDLSSYSIKLSRNGAGWGMYDSTTAEPGFIYQFTGTLDNDEVFVLAADQAGADILTVADDDLSYPSVCHFSGDDAIGLFKNDTLIDVIGVPSVDPGAGWEVAGIADATKDHTLVRKPFVEYGNIDWTSVAGVDSLSSEWLVYPQNEFSYLGSHNQPVNSNENEIVSFVLAEQAGPATINNTAFTVDITVIAGTDVTSLSPVITVSTGATVDPASGASQDFTNPVVYTVTSQTGVAQAWTVSVSLALDADLFFSEYVEGSSNNKALEIYNPTAASVNLDDYIIRTNYNGNPWSGFHTFPAGASLAAGDVWVIANDGADAAVLAVADEVFAYNQSGYIVGFNGDDARGLYKIVGTDTLLIDIIGDPSVDPGDGWDVAGVAAATKDHTLVRKPTVTQGNLDWAVSAGTSAGDSEWIVNPQDDFSNLGTNASGGNVAPIVSNVTILPEIVTDADTVAVGATITDTDGTVTDVSFAWGLDGVSFPNPISLTAIANVYGTYPNTIPAQASGTTVYFRFVAVDDSNDTTTYIGEYTVAAPPANATIYEIQGQLDASPFEGQIVTTSGIVTGLLPGSSQGYFIQDGDGAWNGIFVYDNVNLPAVGDDITITCLVAEYYDLTELKEVASFTINSSGNTLPNPSILTAAEVNDEAYEGVFVRVENAECTNADYGYGMWAIYDGSDTTLVHNNGSYEYVSVLGEHYNVQGILNYNFSEWKIELRMEGDVTIYNDIIKIDDKGFVVYPNPASSVLNVSKIDNIKSISLINILGSELQTISNLNSDNNSIDISELNSGIYFLRITNNDGSMNSIKFIKE